MPRDRAAGDRAGAPGPGQPDAVRRPVRGRAAAAARAGRRPHEEIREALERLNAGRLRVAAKGVDRSRGADSPLVAVPESDQASGGLYMLGQVAALRDRVTTIERAAQRRHDGRHRPGSSGRARPSGRDAARLEPSPAADRHRGDGGRSSRARGTCATFWENTLRRRRRDHRGPRRPLGLAALLRPRPEGARQDHSKWGGFVPDVPFDPLRYGMPPTSLPSIEPVQLLALEAAAGGPRRRRLRGPAVPARADGRGPGHGRRRGPARDGLRLPLVPADARHGHPRGRAATPWQRCEGLLPEWTEDSFPGFLLNVAAGRVANRFDLGGANYTVDAACGSSLAAAALAVRELETGAADMVILGGADTVQNPFTYLAFSKTQAFSPRGRCRPFDAGGRRDRDQRGRGGRGPQAAGRRRARRRPDLRRDQGRRVPPATAAAGA